MTLLDSYFSTIDSSDEHMVFVPYFRKSWNRKFNLDVTKDGALRNVVKIKMAASDSE